MRNTIILFGFSVFFSCLSAHSQGKDNLDIWFGWRNFYQPAINETEELNFFDYYMKNDDTTDSFRSTYEYLGVGWSKRWSQHWESDLRITINSALRANTIFMRGIYYPENKYGFFLDYYMYPQLMNSFTPYFENRPNKYIADINDYNWWQWQMFDFAFSLGVIRPVKLGYSEIIPAISAGVILGPIFEKSVLLKEIQSNYRELIEYEFANKPTPFIKTEVEIKIALLSTAQTIFGLQIKTDALVGLRSIDYYKTSSEWTMNNSISEKIYGPKHLFFKNEFDIGLYITW